MPFEHAKFDYYGGEKRYKKWPSKSEYRVLQRLEEGEQLLRCLVCGKRVNHLSNQKRKSAPLKLERKKLPYCEEHTLASPYAKEVLARIEAEESGVGRLLEILKEGHSLAKACSIVKCPSVLAAKKELEALGYRFLETRHKKLKNEKYYWLKQGGKENPGRSTRRKCATCKKPLKPRKGPGRPPKYCKKCR